MLIIIYGDYMTFSNQQLRKQLKDALADQKGVISAKLAASQALTSDEAKILKNMLADQRGLITAQLASGAPSLTVSQKKQLQSDLADMYGQLTDT